MVRVWRPCSRPPPGIEPEDGPSKRKPNADVVGGGWDFRFLVIGRRGAATSRPNARHLFQMAILWIPLRYRRPTPSCQHYLGKTQALLTRAGMPPMRVCSVTRVADASGSWLSQEVGSIDRLGSPRPQFGPSPNPV